MWRWTARANSKSQAPQVQNPSKPQIQIPQNSPGSFSRCQSSAPQVPGSTGTSLLPASTGEDLPASGLRLEEMFRACKTSSLCAVRQAVFVGWSQTVLIRCMPFALFAATVGQMWCSLHLNEFFQIHHRPSLQDRVVRSRPRTPTVVYLNTLPGSANSWILQTRLRLAGKLRPSDLDGILAPDAARTTCASVFKTGRFSWTPCSQPWRLLDLVPWKVRVRLGCTHALKVKDGLGGMCVHARRTRWPWPQLL